MARARSPPKKSEPKLAILGDIFELIQQHDSGQAGIGDDLEQVFQVEQIESPLLAQPLDFGRQFGHTDGAFHFVQHAPPEALRGDIGQSLEVDIDHAVFVEGRPNPVATSEFSKCLSREACRYAAPLPLMCSRARWSADR